MMSNAFSESREVGSAIQPCSLQQKPVHWIEIELVGEDDQPIPWVEYKIKLPNSTLLSGYLDHDGFARVDGLSQAGMCGVCFPEMDEEAWTFVQSYPAEKPRHA